MGKQTVGILTFHQALNYGAVLQAYALKEVCDELGYDAHVIDYNLNGVREKVAPFSAFKASNNKKKALFKLIRSLMSYKGDKKREKEFVAFRGKYLNESCECNTIDDVVGLDYDVLISGSDQIWNYRITGGKFDPIFFLDIDSPAKKILYAASSHDTPFPLDMELRFKEYLDRTTASIGIRETKLTDYVESVTGRRYPNVLDPTLLAGKEIMSKIPTTENDKESYILLYQIDSNPASDICVKSLEKRFGCKVYTMTVPRLGDVHGRRGDAGPEKFLSLLKGARFLVTNSFHGIALSLIFEKQFYVYENGGVMSRIDSLLGLAELTDRKVKMVADIDLDLTIDYAAVTPRLEQHRAYSKQFLIDALNGKQMIGEEKVSKTPSLLKMSDRQAKDCCGCTACVSACPVNAIRMQEDREGFLYPVIDKTLCVNCGKCDRVCGFCKTEKRAKPFELPYAYGVKHKEISVRETSRSGGAFVALAELVLRRNGTVYGAAMQDDFSVKHIRATDMATCEKMKKAKYVQSDMKGICEQVAADLSENQHVLFSGTPCQVAGVRAYLKERRVQTDTLLCCDLVCHGVPSPMVWSDYLKWIETTHGKKIVAANFRDKQFGWDSHCETFRLEGTDKQVVMNDYTDLFYQHIMLRPSCHHCPFANVYRPGDLTLADFWGIEKNDPSFDDNRGVSLVLVSTEKGQAAFKEACEHFEYFECPVENCMQPTLFKPSAPSARREQFWNDYQTMPFDNLIKTYTKPLSSSGRLKKTLKRGMYRVGLRKHP